MLPDQYSKLGRCVGQALVGCTCKVPLASWHSRFCKSTFNGNVHLWTRSSAPQQCHTITAPTPLRLLLRYLTSHSSPLLGQYGGKELACFCVYTDGRLWIFLMWEPRWFLKQIIVGFANTSAERVFIFNILWLKVNIRRSSLVRFFQFQGLSPQSRGVHYLEKATSLNAL